MYILTYKKHLKKHVYTYQKKCLLSLYIIFVFTYTFKKDKHIYHMHAFYFSVSFYSLHITSITKQIYIFNKINVFYLSV